LSRRCGILNISHLESSSACYEDSFTFLLCIFSNHSNRNKFVCKSEYR
jgi:hypothetical protein